MRIAVEEAVPEDHRQPRLGDDVREIAALVDRPVVGLEICELDALEVLEGENALTRVTPVEPRDDDIRVPGEVAVEDLGVAGLLPIVELLTERACELVDDLATVDEVERMDPLLDESRGLLEQLDVALDLARSVRPLNLDRDLLPVRKHRAVHLSDRRSRHRHLVELEKQATDRLLQILGDHPLDIGERERRHVVLEATELDDDVLGDDVGSRGEQLPELDEGRPELVEHLAEMASTNRVDVGGSTAAFEQRPEAVLHRDLGDLAQPPDVRRLRL